MEFYTPECDLKRNEGSILSMESLPWGLLIGDSISQGYTPLVREMLAGKINIERPSANCGDTRAGLENLESWLGDRHWQVIHFNWGLHDLCYRHPESTHYGNRDKINGSISITADQYRLNLNALVIRLKQAADKLIWASTTKIPPDEAGRFEGDEIRYNSIAADVMSKHGVPTNDLYRLTAGFRPDLFTLPCDVHFSEEGYRLIARHVADCLLNTLTSPALMGKVD